MKSPIYETSPKIALTLCVCYPQAKWTRAVIDGLTDRVRHHGHRGVGEKGEHAKQKQAHDNKGGGSKQKGRGA